MCHFKPLDTYRHHYTKVTTSTVLTSMATSGLFRYLLLYHIIYWYHIPSIFLLCPVLRWLGAVAPSAPALAVDGSQVDVEVNMSDIPDTSAPNDQRTRNPATAAAAPVMVDIMFESSYAGNVRSAVRERPTSEGILQETDAGSSICLVVSQNFPEMSPTIFCGPRQLFSVSLSRFLLTPPLSLSRNLLSTPLSGAYMIARRYIVLNVSFRRVLVG